MGLSWGSLGSAELAGLAGPGRPGRHARGRTAVIVASGAPRPVFGGARRGGPCRDQVVRWILELEAWARGRTTRRSMFTCEGRVTAQAMVSATSSALRGSATPS